MKVYVEAQSKAALIRRLAAGEEISGYNYSMFGGAGHYMLDDSLEDGTIIAIYSQMSQGNPVAKSWGTWTNGVLKAETFEAFDPADEYDNFIHKQEMAEEAYEEYLEELEEDDEPLSFDDWLTTITDHEDSPEYDAYMEEQWKQMQEDDEEIARLMEDPEYTTLEGTLDSETFESPVSCKICGKTFDSFRGLNGHMNAHIPSHRKRAETYAGIKEYDEKCPFCEKELSEDWWDGLEWIVEEGGRAKFHRSIEVNCPHCNEEFYIDDEDFSYADHMAGWEPSYIDQAESFSAENPKKAKPTFVLVTFEVYDGDNEYTLHHIMSENEYDTTEEGDLIKDFFGEADPDGSMFWIDSERAASIVAAQPITLHTRKLLNKLGFYAESFEAISDDYSISMKRSNPLSRHYIPTKKKSAESFSADIEWSFCMYCHEDYDESEEHHCPESKGWNCITCGGNLFEIPDYLWTFCMNCHGRFHNEHDEAILMDTESLCPSCAESLGAESFSAEGGCVHHNYPMAGTPDLSFDNDGSVWYEIVCGNCGATAEGAFYPEEWGEEMYAWNDAESFSAENRCSVCGASSHNERSCPYGPDTSFTTNLPRTLGIMGMVAVIAGGAYIWTQRATNGGKQDE